MSRIRVVDVETGPDPIEGEPGIIEFGYCDLVARGRDLLGDPQDWDVVGGKYWFINPGRPIPAETSAVHHIIYDDVVNAITWPEFIDGVTGVAERDGVIAFAAHGAKFETELLGSVLGDMPWACTYKTGLHLWPDAASFSNNGLRYHIRPEGLDRRTALPAHRAFPDAYVTAFILRDALNRHVSFNQVLDWSTKPALLPRCKIGSFRNGGKGTPWSEVDSSFMRWVLDKDFDEDTKYTVRHHLEQREIDQRLEAERQEVNRQFEKNGMTTVGVDHGTGDASVAHVATEDPSRVPSDVMRDYDVVISPSGRRLKDRWGETANPLIDQKDLPL